MQRQAALGQQLIQPHSSRSSKLSSRRRLLRSRHRRSRHHRPGRSRRHRGLRRRSLRSRRRAERATLQICVSMQQQ